MSLKAPEDAFSTHETGKTQGTQNFSLRQLFNMCDTNGDGVIGLEEFLDLSSRFGIDDDDARAIFIDLDFDGDGQINFDDFAYGFNDFLTPGSRRGSLQVSFVDGVSATQQLIEMEKKHDAAQNAWKQFVTNIQPPMPTSNNEEAGSQTQKQKGRPEGGITELLQDLRKEKSPEISTKLESALASLICDMQNLQDEYRSLEQTFRKEREVHAAQLAALGEELDSQLVKTELKAKAEARLEAQKQMESERKKIAVEMENKLGELSLQMRTYEKVEEWLVGEETRDKDKRSRCDSNDYDSSKLIESENRNLKTALAEAQMKATVLQTQLTQKRNEYHDLYQELHSEKMAASEFRNQCDLMQNHLSVLSHANRVLYDANDCHFSNNNEPSSLQPTRVTLFDEINSERAYPMSLPTTTTSVVSTVGHQKAENVKQVSNNAPFLFHGRSGACASSPDDIDSGRETLLDEIRAEGDSSPHPSGVWSLGSHSPTLARSGLTSPDQEQNQELVLTSSPMPPSIPGPFGVQRPTLTLTSSVLLDKQQHSRPSRTSSRENHSHSVPVPSSLAGASAGVFGHGHGHMSNPFLQRTFKVILAGDAAVGKTSFIERVCSGHFVSRLSSTIGVDFRVKNTEYNGQPVVLQLWDTAGQERFRSLTKSYFRRADGVILLYDVTNERTFVNVRHWIECVEEGAGRKIPIVLCGNKIDLREELYRGVTCVSAVEGEKLSQQCGALFTEISPKTGFNVSETLFLLTREMSLVEDAELRSSVKLNAEDSGANANGDPAKSSSCCGGGGGKTLTSSSSSTSSMRSVYSRGGGGGSKRL